VSRSARPRLLPFGDSAVLVVLGEGVDPALNARARRIAAAVEAANRDDPRFGRPVAAYASVLVPVDPIDPGVPRAVEQLERLVEEADASPVGAADDDQQPPIDLPTRYGGPDGPDLDEVASSHGLRPTDVVELHASVVYRVYFLGFAPGFAYLGPLPSELVRPRLASPRPRVPAGSVGIAGEQTAVYPVDSPGGWRLIGRTRVRVWDPTSDPPALLLPGRRVRFVPARD
jgi:KipI family sensor histidine kinase inhibitor